MSTQTDTAVYIYGILPGDVELQEETLGVGDPPAPVRLVRYRDLAALVSDVNISRPLGTPEDLLAHEELLDASAADAPVLPLRFGAVVASEDAVTSELLQAHYDEFSSALQQLEGYAEYIVKGRYLQDAILTEILGEDPQVADLAAQTRGADPILTRDVQMQLGEIIGQQIELKRAQDTQVLAEALQGHVTGAVTRPPTDEFDAVHAAFLIQADGADELITEIEKLASDWDGRVDLRVIGPVAAYDFVGTPAPTAEA